MKNSLAAILARPRVLLAAHGWLFVRDTVTRVPLCNKRRPRPAKCATQQITHLCYQHHTASYVYAIVRRRST